MFIIRLFFNLLIVAVEVGLAGAAGWLAWKMPLIFAAVTAALAVVMGMRLEVRRLAFEMPFYFERTGGISLFVRSVFASGHALFKGVVAGLVTLMTFSGTEPNRLMVVAGIFSACVLIGSTILRRLTISFGAKPAHWGFFRMGAPLGLLFSFAMGFFPPPSSLDVVRRVLFDLPARPGIAQASEALFSVRLWFDDLIVRMISVAAGGEWGKVAGLFVGSNVLTGFILAIYAVVVSEVVRTLEEANWRLQGHRKVRG